MDYSCLESRQSPDLESSATTVVDAIDIDTVYDKKRYQSAILAEHMIFLRKEDFSLLVQYNLMEELIQVVGHVDTIRKASYRGDAGPTAISEINSNESKGVNESQEDERGSDDDNNEDEEYEFESPNEEYDDSDVNDEEEHSNLSMAEELIYKDIATQTYGDTIHIVTGPIVFEQPEKGTNCHFVINSIHDPE